MTVKITIDRKTGALLAIANGQRAEIEQMKTMLERLSR